jgi:ribonuclease Z
MVFEVTVLGANSANFAYGRHHTAQVLNHNQVHFLIDCGEGTQLQMLRYRLRLMRLQYVFITHLHGDHYLGLVGILLTMQLQGRSQPLEVYGPPGLDEIITLQLRCSDTQLNYKITFHKVLYDQPTQIFENEHLTVTAVPLQHRVVCHGYIFREKQGKRRMLPEFIERFSLHPGQINALRRGNDILDDSGQLIVGFEEATLPALPPRSYAFLSDTRYLPHLAPHLEGIDLMYHEATFTHDMLPRAEATYHSTAVQAAQLASAAQVTTLMLGHFSSRFRDLNPLLTEGQGVFPNTILAEEGCRYTISQDGDGIKSMVRQDCTARDEQSKLY